MAWLYQPLLPAAADIQSAGPLATAYWVGGAGTWNATNTANWAATSGGPGGAGYPDSNSTVYFDSNSGLGSGQTIVINGGVCKDVNFSLSGTGALLNLTGSLTVYGSWTKTGFLTTTTTTGTGTLTFASTTSSTITTGSTPFWFNVIFDGVGGTWTLQDNLTVESVRATTLTNGTLDLNGKTFSTGTFSSVNVNTRSLISSTPATVNITSTSSGTVWSVGFASTMTGSNNITVNITGNDAGTSKSVDAGDFASGANAFNFTVGGNSTQIVLTGGSVINNLTITATTCTVINGSPVNIYGNLNIAGAGPSITSNTGSYTFRSTAGTKTITTNGVEINTNILFNGAGGTWQLVDNLNITTVYSSTVTLTNGTLDLNGKTLTAGSSFVTATGTKNITFNGGTLLCVAASTTAFNNAAPTGFTTTAGTGIGKISMSAATAKTFVGGDSLYNCTLENAGAGALTISGSNTFNNITNSVQPATFTFTAGTTTTVNEFTVSGTAENIVTINSTGAAFTLSKSSGTVSVSYCTISNSTATGGAIWQAFTANGNTDGGGNTGWIFIGGIKIVIDSNVVLGAGILISF